MPDQDNGYWKGMTDAQMQGMQACLEEVKGEIQGLRREIQALKLWKAMVLGGAAATSAIVSALVSLWSKLGM